MAAAEINVPFEDIVEVCQISSSQEEILRRCPFVDPDGGAPPSSGGIPVSSTGIAMLTLPDTAQDATKDRGSQDVFHTPPEQQSSQYTSDAHHCSIHKAVETDDETLGFFEFSEYAEAADIVDLGDDSELGFPLAKLNQMTDRTLVAECFYGNDGASVIETSNSDIDKFRISKRHLSSKDNLGDSPHKKMKNSEQNVPHPRQNIQIDKEMCLTVGDKNNHFAGISVEKNLGSCENLGSHVVQSEMAKSIEECVENIESKEGNYEADKSACPDVENRTVNEIAETSERPKGGSKQPELSVFPSSAGELLKNMAKMTKDIEKGNSFVFEVLKALKKENPEQDSLENVSLLHLAKTRGFNFPRPFWWKGEDKEKD